MRTLGGAKAGDVFNVVRIHGEGALRRRIMDMGITRGIEISVRKVAPLGDPLQLTVRGTELSMRRSDADLVEVAESGR